MSDKRYEVRLITTTGATELDISSTGDKALWAPGLIPHMLRGVAVICVNAVGATGTINFDKRVTYASDTGRVDNVIAAISLTTAHTAGKVVYRAPVAVLINPGEELVVAADDAAAAGDLVAVTIFVEPLWENPANLAAMVATA